MLLDGLTLPDDYYWEDEWSWSEVETSTDYTLGGYLIVEQALKLAGRPITLINGWIPKVALSTLEAKRDEQGKIMVLILPDGRIFNTMFRYSDGEPLIVAPAVPRSDYTVGPDWFDVQIKLMEV